MPFFMNLAQLHHCFKNSSGVVTDSRELKPDCFFIALRGEKYDGNLFAEKALKNGAKYALVDRPACIRRKQHSPLRYAQRADLRQFDDPSLGRTA